MSWVSQYQGMSDFIPGVYAMNVNSNAMDGNEDYYDEDDDYWEKKISEFFAISKIKTHFISQ